VYVIKIEKSTIPHPSRVSNLRRVNNIKPNYV